MRTKISQFTKKNWHTFQTIFASFQHRVAENYDVHDFELTPEDMIKMDALDRGSAGRTFHMNFLKSDMDVFSLPTFPKDDRDIYTF